MEGDNGAWRLEPEDSQETELKLGMIARAKCAWTDRSDAEVMVITMGALVIVPFRSLRALPGEN